MACKGQRYLCCWAALALLAGCGSRTPSPQNPTHPGTRAGPPEDAVVPLPGNAPLKRSPLDPARRDYFFPIPQGFVPGESLRGTMRTAAARLSRMGGTMLVTRHKGFGGGALTGIIAVAPAVAGVGVSTDVRGCKRTARTLGRNTGHTITFAGLVPVGQGRGCQIRAVAGKASTTPHGRIMVTLVEHQASAWLINCTFDDRDIVAIQGCKTVIAGWRFVR